tara:strand:+ start:250 stop:420 length:171 start_codon:yes stop_codon:yes gene_type:complete
MSFQQAQDEQERQQQIIRALERIEDWCHTREDVLFLASELGLLHIYQGATQDEIRR